MNSTGQGKLGMKAQEREKRMIQSAIRLGVQSEDLDEVLNAARKESRGPNLWQEQTHQKPKIRDQNKPTRKGEERDLFKDEISTRKSFYFTT